MVRVVAVDHLVIRVSNYEASRAFYSSLFAFLGFEIIDRYDDMTGWRNGLTAFWISRSKTSARPFHTEDIGFQHYAFEVRNRADVDAVEGFLKAQVATIVDPAGAYYDDYYAVYFTDPDGLKLEVMTYGPGHQDAARQK
jgi:catechol 2,3-dioxygenase-like lactoylglutathione lyase family enzyme